ncbi:hypothetical protein WA158_005468 [Blastocystis sp. Blastoise]
MAFTQVVKTLQTIRPIAINIRSFASEAVKEEKNIKKSLPEESVADVKPSEVVANEVASESVKEPEIHDEFSPKVKDKKVETATEVKSADSEIKQEGESTETSEGSKVEGVETTEEVASSKDVKIKQSESVPSFEWPEEEDIYGDLVYALEYSDAVYVPEETKNKIYEMYVKRGWDVSKISQTVKIAKDRVTAIIKLRSRHETLKDKGLWKDDLVKIIENEYKAENKDKGVLFSLTNPEDEKDKYWRESTTNKKDIFNPKKVPSYIPKFVFLNEENTEKQLRGRINQILLDQHAKKVDAPIQRAGVPVEKFPYSKPSHHGFCLLDSSYGSNKSKYVLQTKEGTRVEVNNWNEVNRSWNKWRKQYQSTLEGIEQEIPNTIPSSPSSPLPTPASPAPQSASNTIQNKTESK